MLWGFAKEVLTKQLHVCGMSVRYLGEQAIE